MSKITLEVNDTHLSEIVLILKSLKTGMITKLNVEGKTSSIKNRPNLCLNSSNNGSKYLSSTQFKQKLYKDKS